MPPIWLILCAKLVMRPPFVIASGGFGTTLRPTARRQVRAHQWVLQV